MVRSSQRTLYMADLDLHRQLGVQYKPLTNTTLNEKFGVLVSEEIPNQYPKLNGFVIGIGGSPVVEGYESYAFNEHSPIDGALFQHVPFIVREYSMDLTEEERANYRLRVVETINNKQYCCYYMKLIPSFELKTNFYSIKTVLDGTSVASPSLSVFDTNMSSILNPVPRNRSLSYETMGKSEYVTKLAKVDFILTENEQEELVKALEVKNLESRLVTELGLCTGIDFNTDYGKESLATQIAYHIPINFTLTLEFANRGNLSRAIELGGMEPFLY